MVKTVICQKPAETATTTTLTPVTTTVGNLVTCNFSVDDYFLGSVSYNGKVLGVTGTDLDWPEPKTVEFVPDPNSPGELRLDGLKNYQENVDHCRWAGLILTCTAQDTGR